jgi:hypothetical protein
MNPAFQSWCPEVSAIRLSCRFDLTRRAPMPTMAAMNLRPARVLLIAAGLLALPFRAPAPLVYMPGEGWVYKLFGGSTNASNELVLRQQTVPYVLASLNPTFDTTNAPFLKEPELSKQGVFRGVMRFGKQDTQNAIALLWDQPKSKLYLDLNGNLDLTDDPAGAFSSSNKGGQQDFTNVIVLLRAAEGLHPAIMNMRLWSDAVGHKLHGLLEMHSLWEAKVGPSGEEWQVAALDDPFNPQGPAFAKFLLLRPWTARTNRMYLQDLKSGVVPFPEQLFWLGEAFRLERRFDSQEGMPVCELQFTPQQPPLTEVKLSGESLYYAVLQDPKGYTAVLRQLPGSLKIPSGRYSASAVWLKKGAAEAFRFANEPSLLNATAPTNLALGGPLMNSVTFAREGRKLRLNYRLLGADGGGYWLVQIDQPKPPEFTVYRGGKKVLSGQFVFG